MVIVVEVVLVEADSGCFPLDFDELVVRFGEVGDAFVYRAIMSATAQRETRSMTSPGLQI